MLRKEQNLLNDGVFFEIDSKSIGMYLKKI